MAGLMRPQGTTGSAGRHASASCNFMQLRAQHGRRPALVRHFQLPGPSTFSIDRSPRHSQQQRASVQAHAAQEQPGDRALTHARAKPEAWMVVCAVAAVALGLCNFHRNTFSALLPELAAHYSLHPSEVGLLSSAMLVGYLVGQVPSGVLADKLGGERVLLVCLVLWSVATALTGIVPAMVQANGVAALAACRAAMGLFSACAMPSVSALTARWVPAKYRASAISSIYLFFNLGGVLGLACLPFLSAKVGWAQAFIMAGMGGVAWAAMGTLCLPRVPYPPAPSIPRSNKDRSGQHPTSGRQQQSGSQSAPSVNSTTSSGINQSDPSGNSSQPAQGLPWHQRSAVQVAVLCWAHAVIGWGFFIFQSWIPLYLKSLGSQSATGTGLLAGLPWLAAGFGGTLAGQISDRLMQRGVPRLAVRHGMHVVSTLGCAACALPLALSSSVTPAEATGWLVAFHLCYAATFGGFHPYVQEVGTSYAGRLIALTNSCSIGLGILGNLATGWLLEATGTYTSVFWVTAGLYLTSLVAFLAVLKGAPIKLSKSGAS